MNLLKHIYLPSMLIGLILLTITAQSQVTVSRHTSFINLGVGFQGSRFHTVTWRPSINAHAEYAIIKNTTVGIEGNYYGEKIAKNSSFNSYSVGVRSSYYFNSPWKKGNKKNKYYAGFGIMYYQFKYTDFSSNKGKIYIPVHLGARRLIYKNYGVNAQLAFNDMGFIKVGVFAKF